MAIDDNGGHQLTAVGSSAVEQVRAGDPGTALVVSNPVPNPGMPPHRQRVTDIDPRKRRRAERVVYVLFYLSIVGTVWSIAAYMAFPIHSNDPSSVHMNNMMIGVGTAFALLTIGVAAVHWGKALMFDGEGVDIRHPQRQKQETIDRAVEIFQIADRESGFNRRVLVRNSMIAALAMFPLPAIVMFRGLAPENVQPAKLLAETMWRGGMRLTRDPEGTPIKASDVTLGSAFHVIPEGLESRSDALEQKAKAAVLMMRLEPKDLHVSPGREDWNYHGIVAYSKICTHVGCPVALYEQQTHHLLCPCHQSQFDITHEARVIFGPAKRPLPQLPITVDAEGYLIARSGFDQPVGPSFWERT